MFIVRHIGPDLGVLLYILNQTSTLRAAIAVDGEPITPGRVYVAPIDTHMTLEPGVVRLNQDAKIHGVRPAADPLFLSAAQSYGERAIGVMLGGNGMDGIDGLLTLRRSGGAAFVLDVADLRLLKIPPSTLPSEMPEFCQTTAQLAPLVLELCCDSMLLRPSLPN